MLVHFRRERNMPRPPSAQQNVPVLFRRECNMPEVDANEVKQLLILVASLTG